jgi:hypothetical protein
MKLLLIKPGTHGNVTIKKMLGYEARYIFFGQILGAVLKKRLNFC